MLIIVSVHQKTPLHMAVESGNDATVRFFVDKGADVNIKDNKGVRKITNHSVFGVISTVSSKYVIDGHILFFDFYLSGRLLSTLHTHLKYSLHLIKALHMVI